MGYRSEVSVVMTRNLFAEMFRQIPDQVTELIRYSDRFESLDNCILLYWNSIKWYDDSSPVRQFMNVLGEAEEAEYHFIELGEDYNDNKDRGDFYDNPFSTCMVRRISIDASGKPVELNAFM